MNWDSELHHTDGTVDVTEHDANLVFASRQGGFEAGVGMKYELFKFGGIHFEVRYQQGKAVGFSGDSQSPDISYLTNTSKTLSVLIGLSF
jgi:hypothetical protein